MGAGSSQEFIIDEGPTEISSAPPVAAAAPIIQYVEVPCNQTEEPTEIHHIKLGQCPCSQVAVAAPVQFFEDTEEERAYGGAFPWWLLPLLLLGLLLLSMLLAW